VGTLNSFEDKVSSKVLYNLENHWQKIFLALLLITGLALRVLLAEKIPLWNDEAITANVARSLSENGVPALPSGKEYRRGFPYILLVSISERVFGKSDITMRLPSIMIGTGTIALTYIGGKEVFDQNTGLVAASIVTFLPWQLAWGIQVRMYVMLQFLYLASVILIYRIGEKARIVDALLLALTISIGMMTHRTAYILPVVAAAYLLGTQLYSFSLKKLLFVSVPITAAFTTQLVYRDYLDLLDLLSYHPEHISFYMFWLRNHAQVFMGSGLLGGLLAARKNFRAVYLLALATIPAFLVYGFFVEYDHKRYIHFMIPMIGLLAGLLFSEATKIGGYLPRISREKFFAGALIVVLAFSASGLDYSYDNHVYRPYFDHETVYDYISEHDSEEDILITQWTSSATYYYKAPDYSLQGDGYMDIRKRYSYKGEDEYSGAEFVFKASELEKIVMNSSGWLVMRETGFLWKPNATQSVIKGGMREVGDFKNMRVWKWDYRRRGGDTSD
jgi:4-amino-4-deoxy-L-arabinose transferase-like glycosyltransferase